MRTSQTITFLAKPHGEEKIDSAAFAYVSARNRQQAFNLLVREIKKSEISQATLSRRTGKGTDVISRIFRRPSNLEIDTLSELVFAITGAALEFVLRHPEPRQDFSTKPATATNNVITIIAKQDFEIAA